MNGGSSNGRTADSDSANTGSNPVPPATLAETRMIPGTSEDISVEDVMPIGGVLLYRADSNDSEMCRCCTSRVY